MEYCEKGDMQKLIDEHKINKKLIDEKNNIRLGDFGFSKLIND